MESVKKSQNTHHKRKRGRTATPFNEDVASAHLREPRCKKEEVASQGKPAIQGSFGVSVVALDVGADSEGKQHAAQSDSSAGIEPSTSSGMEQKSSGMEQKSSAKLDISESTHYSTDASIQQQHHPSSGLSPTPAPTPPTNSEQRDHLPRHSSEHFDPTPAVTSDLPTPTDFHHYTTTPEDESEIEPQTAEDAEYSSSNNTATIPNEKRSTTSTRDKLLTSTQEEEDSPSFPQTCVVLEHLEDGVSVPLVQTASLLHGHSAEQQQHEKEMEEEGEGEGEEGEGEGEEEGEGEMEEEEEGEVSIMGKAIT